MPVLRTKRGHERMAEFFKKTIQRLNRVNCIMQENSLAKVAICGLDALLIRDLSAVFPAKSPLAFQLRFLEHHLK
jgi:hypothetical protein